MKKNQKVNSMSFVIASLCTTYACMKNSFFFAMSAENGNKNSRKMCILLKSHKSFTATSLSTFSAVVVQLRMKIFISK